MPERPRPDLDHTREALRKHDDRVSEDEAEAEREAEDAAEEEDEEE